MWERNCLKAPEGAARTEVVNLIVPMAATLRKVEMIQTKISSTQKKMRETVNNNAIISYINP